MDKQIRRYRLTFWLVLVAISFLLPACQASELPVVNVAVPGAELEQSPIVTSAERGQDLFRTSCAFCHGDNGERGANPLLNTANQLDDTALAEAIRNGVPEKGMPEMKNLTNEQITDLVAFIRSWNSK